MAYDVETRPGTWVARQGRRRERLVWALIGSLLLLGLLALGFLVAGRATILTSLVLLGVVGIVAWWTTRSMAPASRWLGGARAEEAVGEELNKLRPDFVVMHDLERAGPGNVDHVVSGPTGVYMVETKRYRYEDDDLRKARGRAARVHDELDVWVTPVICPATRECRPYEHDRVWIVPRTRINDWIRAQRNTPVEFDRLARWADQL